MKIVITGLAGVVGRRVAEALVRQGHTVLGIDRRPWPDAPPGVEMFRVDVRKRPAEDVFRTHRPEAVIHMATVSYFSARREERYRINLGGTRAVFDYCERYGVEQALFIGRHTIYGAAPDAPLYRTEIEPPLAVATFPDLADLVAADLYASQALWRLPALRTAVLRIVYTLGPSRRGTLSSYIGERFVPTVMGFDPLYQFMHEHDAADAIVRALTAKLHGVYNVAGPSPVPLSLLCKVTGRTAVPIPEPLFPRVLGHFGFPKLPSHAVNHVKHPVVVDDAAFRAACGFIARYDEIQTMDAWREAG
ncbi:MAG: NAD-dependent epimerase/dehydratase family protein [Myxococcales bacterium]|nr:NAD-dependent epimerase/dehydratase family protein [Myxococcales bacterium]MCB9547141.1 NAD-dependent epimerase/dehydratase family protein [Myxococcales bacterium]